VAVSPNPQILTPGLFLAALPLQAFPHQSNFASGATAYSKIMLGVPEQYNEKLASQRAIEKLTHKQR